jgi:Tol biopolymer transport system component
LVTAEGQEATVLTDDPLAIHSAPSWSPDGRQLAYMRFEMAETAGLAGVWLHDLASGRQQLVEESAFLPGWLE